MPQNRLLRLLTELFALLQKTQPVVDQTDIAWVGPFYIPRSGVWASTYFRIYEMQLHLFVLMGRLDYLMIWDLRSRQYDCSPLDFGFAANSEEFWDDVLTQVNRRLVHALKSPAGYNRRVEARLPLRYRTGKIQRAFTWSEGEEPAIEDGTLQTLEAMLATVEPSPRLRKLTVADYLNAASIAYDAAFEHLVSLSAVEKYKSKADGRHGGMLDLPRNNAKAFAQWFNSRCWAGTHPWEIVYANPHGVMFSPRYDEKTSTWGFDFSVHTEHLYAHAVKMAIALARQVIPFGFYNSAKVVAVLRGEDFVNVGMDDRALGFDLLKEIRPDSIEHIRWDPVPQINPISADQLRRLSGLMVVKRKPGRKAH